MYAWKWEWCKEGKIMPETDARYGWWYAMLNGCMSSKHGMV